MSKINISDIAAKLRAQFKDDKAKANIISTGADMLAQTDDKDFVVMPSWWQAATGLKGLPFGYVFMISGNPDSGKTSATIEAMRCAQQQGIQIILVDTEKKTTKSRLVQWGVDPENIARVQPNYLEEAYDGIDKWLDAIKDADPDSRILVIFDSLGNTPARAEADNAVEDSLQMGLAAKINKRGFRRLVPKLARDKIHVLVVNQTYANMGSPGRTNAGGQAVDYFSVLTFQTSRFKWLEKVVKGEQIRIGARVQWTAYKNHLVDANSVIQKRVQLDITGEGIALVGANKRETKTEEDE